MTRRIMLIDRRSSLGIGDKFYSSFTSNKSIADFWIAINAFMMILASLLVTARIYVRLRILKSLIIVDALLLVGWMLFIVERSLTFPVMLPSYADIPLTTSALDRMHYLTYVKQIIHGIALCIIRLSVLFQFLQIFTTAKYSGRWNILVALIASNIAFYTIFTFGSIFLCTPIDAAWNKDLDNTARCLDNHALQITSATLNMIVDWIMLFLPMVWIWKLQTSRSRRAGLTTVFAVGFLAVVASIMRLLMLIDASTYPGVHLAAEYFVALFAGVEETAGLIVCSVPALPKLFDRSKKRTNAPRRRPFPELAERHAPRRDYADAVLNDIERSNSSSSQASLIPGRAHFSSTTSF